MEAHEEAWRAWRAYNDSTTHHPDEGRLVEWIARAAAEFPERPAVRAVDGTLTYAELDARSDAVADAVRGAGVSPGGIVAVESTRTVGTYAALLGVVKAGCGFVPVDPTDPPQRRHLVLDDARAEALVSAAGTVTPTATPVERDPDPACYVIHTSGTTGRPKGVRIGERSVLNFVHWMVSRHSIGAHHRLAQAASLTFDPSVQQIFPAWVTGACVVPVPEAELLDPRALARWLRRERITHLDIVTSHWQQLREAIAGEPALGELPDLRWIVIGGETMHYEQVHQWHRLTSSPALLDNIYGPTEATINATWVVLDPEVEHGQVPIGVPLPNYRLYVVDEHHELCPPEVVGELLIAGDGLALRYQSAEATAKAFGSLDLPDGGTERVYRSGDLACLRPNGQGGWTLEFRGRTDSQVKIRGFRVEIEEVEAAVTACPGVRGGAVLVRGNPAEQLVCVYAAAEEVSAADVRRFVAGRLAAHQVPNLYLRRDALPLTRNGKLDRAALAAALPEAMAGRHPEGRAPSGELEERIAEAWSTGLGVGAVGAEEDFFSIGGTSVLAVRVVGGLRDRGLPVEPGDLFGNPTVAGLAGAVDQRIRAALTSDSVDG
ncbi:non-ribosomal peptide synthetase [Actinosynnema sp. NPDC050801]|uniref:non-ribosomal peptide synthetase n=1 Tax=unclassified Actinosynnema TaxID=2637065 RepID=UPI0033EF2DEC